MDPIPREKLRQLVVRFGPEIGRDARRCEALLRDVCGSHKKEIFALANAVKEGIPAEIGSPIQGVPPKIMFARHAKRLHENLGISEDLCLWTVESWAYALGVVSKRDLQSDIRCPECDTRIAIPVKLHGKPVKCPKCDARLLVSADGSNLERREAEVPRPSSIQPVQKVESHLPQLGLIRSETAEDLYRQVVDRMVATSDLISANHPELEQTRVSLGLSTQSANQIVQEVLAGRSHRNAPFAHHMLSPKDPFCYPPSASNPTPQSSNGLWYLRTNDGGQYGPLDDNLIGRWAAEGRITPDTLVWCEGWTGWYHAERVEFLSTFVNQPLHLPAKANQGHPSAGGASDNPITIDGVPEALAARAANILNIGIWSIAANLCCCPPLAIILGIIVLGQVGEVQSKLGRYDDAKELIGKVEAGKQCAFVGIGFSLVLIVIWLAAQASSL